MSGSEYLIRELRRQREAMGLSQEAWGERIHFSAQHVGAVERGERPALPDYLKAVDKAFGTTHCEFYELFIRSEVSPVWFRPWVDHERDAVMLRCFDPLVIPGLLQTESYARAVLTDAGTFGDDVVDAVAARMARQEVLFRDEKPVRFIGVVDEAALRRRVGGPAVMREQLHAIVKATERPNIRVHVVPASVGAYAGLNGDFALATVDGRCVGFLDGPLKGQVVESADEIAALESAWESIRGYALPCDQSVALILEVAESWQ